MKAIPWRWGDNGEIYIPLLQPDGQTIHWYQRVKTEAGVVRRRFEGQLPDRKRMLDRTGQMATVQFSFFDDAGGELADGTSGRFRYVEADGTERILNVIEKRCGVALVTGTGRERSEQEIEDEIRHWITALAAEEIRQMYSTMAVANDSGVAPSRFATFTLAPARISRSASAVSRR